MKFLYKEQVTFYIFSIPVRTCILFASRKKICIIFALNLKIYHFAVNSGIE